MRNRQKKKENRGVPGELTETTIGSGICNGYASIQCPCLYQAEINRKTRPAVYLQTDGKLEREVMEEAKV